MKSDLSEYEKGLRAKGVCLACKCAADGVEMRFGTSEMIYSLHPRTKADWCEGYCKVPGSLAQAVVAA